MEKDKSGRFWIYDRDHISKVGDKHVAPIKESLPYIGFLRENTPEAQEENHRRFETALEKHAQYIASGYMPTLIGYMPRIKR